MNFNFGEVLTRAWQITWKHKVLWIFGILAGCSRGNTRFNANSGGGGGDGGGTGQLPPEWMRVLEFIQENLAVVVVTLCVVSFLFFAITIFLSTIGKIGLIRGASQADAGVQKLIFGQLFSESTPYFWRMFALSLLISIPVVVVLAALIAGLVAFGIAAANTGSDAAIVGVVGLVPVVIGCFCLLVPVMFVVGLIVRQAENAIVLENLPVLPSLSRGWEIFRRNLGPLLVTAIILVVLSLAVGLVIAIPVFLIAAPSMLAFIASEGENWTPMIVMGVGLCLYAPILWLLNGILTTYTESVWTLAYLRLTRPPEAAPVVLPEANA